ncbi:cytochrome c3 family protein [Chloroflexota bacterium]
MIRKISIYAAVALTLVSICIPLLTTIALAADGGVKQVTVSVDPKINPGDTVNITVTVITGSDDSWSGTITVTTPVPSIHTCPISGSGSNSTWANFPGTFTNLPSTTTDGTYTIAVNANILGQTPVTGTVSFDVKDYYMSVSASPIVKGGSLTVTVHTTNSLTVDGGTVTVTAPGSSTSEYSTFAPGNGDQTTTAFPTGLNWSGPANTAAAGVYNVSFDAGSGVVDTLTFDVQDASPHVGAGFGKTTYACAGCHRTHAGASGAKLLKDPNQLDLCNSCHDGTGANTDVVHGVYLGNTEGTQNAGLRGGGFTDALMDTDADGETEPLEVNSKHTIAQANVIAWGSGDLNSGAGVSFGAVPLQCGNCHNPHGNDSYRILKSEPTGLGGESTGLSVPILASLENSKNYTIAYDSNNFRDMGGYPTGVLALMSEWCGQCHERYVAGSGAGSSPSGDSVFSYRHMTDGLGGECLKCHVAHGTSATMGGNSASAQITWPDDESAGWQNPDEDHYSRLLHVDNRGVCMQCHTTDELTGN